MAMKGFAATVDIEQHSPIGGYSFWDDCKAPARMTALVR